MSSRQRRPAALLVGLVVALLTAVPTAPAAATPIRAADEPAPAAPSAPAGDVTWSLAPAVDRAADGRISLRHTADPGQSVADQVLLTNFSSRAVTFLLYASDGTVGADGAFDLLPSGAAPTDGGSWITLGPVDGATPAPGGALRLEVPAAAAVPVPVAIAVPADASPGDHPAGVVAELVPDAGAQVAVAPRLGVRVHLRVSGDVVARLVPADVRATWVPSWNPFAPGHVRLDYDVANQGNVRLGAQSVASLRGWLGLGTASVTRTAREVLPRQRASVDVSLTAWPTVRTTGSVEVTPSVLGDDDVPVDLAAVTVRFSVWTVPWSQLALAVLVAGAWWAVRWARRRSAARVQARIDAAVAALATVPEEAPVE
jgi:hypothetical protein